MTAIVAVSGPGGVYIAADELTSSGGVTAGRARKLITFEDYSVAFAGNLSAISQWQAEPPEDPPPNHVTERWLRTHWLPDIKKYMSDSDALIAFPNGQIVEYNHGGFELVRMRAKGLRYVASGSGWTIAQAAITALVLYGELHENVLARAGIETAIKLHVDCGGRPQVLRVDSH